MGLSTAGRLYVGVVVCAGLSVLAVASLHWTPADPFRFLVYLLLTIVASGMKVSLPGVTGTMSASYVLLLSSVIQFPLGQVAAVAVVSAFVQCFWRAKERPRLIHLSFNTSVMILSTAVAYAAFHAWPPHMNLVLSVASAACAYFATNTVAIAGVIATTERRPLLTTWKSFYLWSFPYYLLGASIAASMKYITRLNWEISIAVLPMVFIIYRSYSLHIRQLEEQKRHAETMAALHLRTIETLALAIEAKDQTTADHLKRVQIYSKELSQDLGLPEDEDRALQAASILHDVGKIAVPDYIITKPGRLSPEEFDRMKIHPIVGAEIVERIEFPYPVAPIVRAHHEKWDGSGYPLGLRGEEIPIGARILSVVDCFDALASDRQYRKALPLPQAMAVVTHEAGKSFDPRIVELLGRRYLQLEELAQLKPSAEKPKLSLEVKVERGASPDAGFESAAAQGENDASTPAEELANSTERASVFDQFTSPLGISLSGTETLALMCSRVRTLVPADAISLYLVEDGILTPRCVLGENFKLLTALRIPLGQGVAGWVAENHQPILNGNPSVEPGYGAGPTASSPLNSVLAIPLQTSTGTIAVLALYRTERDGFSRDNLRDLLGVGDKLSLAVEIALQHEHSATLRNVAAITGLPNASFLGAKIAVEIAKSRDSNSTLTVLLCGMEGISDVHESFGQQAAEEALQFLARGFRERCRQVDYIAWRGGDDFVFVLPGLSVEAVDARINSLMELTIQAGLELWGADLLALSVGAATFPRNGHTPEMLLGEAERQMFAARRSKVRSNAGSMSENLSRMSGSISEKEARAPAV
ncbi:MAG: HD domain-containing protein [Bryobacterales bacterium]|nr:HD domain-containing protein [Bryobacterales bacterium]